MLGEWYLPPGKCQAISTITEGIISISHPAPLSSQTRIPQTSSPLVDKSQATQAALLQIRRSEPILLDPSCSSLVRHRRVDHSGQENSRSAIDRSCETGRLGTDAQTTGVLSRHRSSGRRWGPEALVELLLVVRLQVRAQARTRQEVGAQPTALGELIVAPNRSPFTAGSSTGPEIRRTSGIGLGAVAPEVVVAGRTKVDGYQLHGVEILACRRGRGIHSTRRNRCCAQDLGTAPVAVHRCCVFPTMSVA